MNKFIKKYVQYFHRADYATCVFNNFKKFLNLKKPSDLNEKLQYLKLRTYYNNPVITECVDKYRVRDYLIERGYERLLPSLIGGPYEDAHDLEKSWH